MGTNLGKMMENGGLVWFYGGLMGFYGIYPVVIQHYYGKSPCYEWENSLFLWGIFGDHVKLPEGNQPLT